MKKHFYEIMIALGLLTMGYQAGAGQIVEVNAKGWRGDVGATNVMTLGKGIWEGLASFEVEWLDNKMEIICINSHSDLGEYVHWNSENGHRTYHKYLDSNISVTDGLGKKFTFTTSKSFYSLVLPVKIEYKPTLPPAHSDCHIQNNKGNFRPFLSKVVYDITKVNSILMTNLDFFVLPDMVQKDWPGAIGTDIPGVELSFDVNTTFYENYFKMGCMGVKANAEALTLERPKASIVMKAPISFSAYKTCESSRKPNAQHPEVDIRIQIPTVTVGYPATDQF